MPWDVQKVQTIINATRGMAKSRTWEVLLRDVLQLQRQVSRQQRLPLPLPLLRRPGNVSVLSHSDGFKEASVKLEPLRPRWDALNGSSCWVKVGEAKRETLPSGGNCSCYWKPSAAFVPPPSSSDIQRGKVHLSWTKPLPVLCSEHLTLNPGEKLRRQIKG